MKKFLVTLALLPALAFGQVITNFVPGQLLTAAQLNNAFSLAVAVVGLPSCSTANSALRYTIGTGFSCGVTYALTSGTLAQFSATTSAQLAGVISDETGSGPLAFSVSPALTGIPTAPNAGPGTNTTQLATTAFVEGTLQAPQFGIGAVTPNTGAFTTLSSSGAFTPSQTAGIVGTNVVNNANAGSVGEYITATGTGITCANSTPANVTSILLTAGDWDVWGSNTWTTAGGGAATNLIVSVSTVSATSAPAPFTDNLALTYATNTASTLLAPIQRINVATNTTAFLVMNQAFATGTCTATGYIAARRRR